MKRVGLLVTLLVAGVALGAPPPPEAEPKSLGEVARRAREKREKEEAARSKPAAPSTTYSNEDLAERKKAGTSNLSLPGGGEVSSTAEAAPATAEGAPGSGEAPTEPASAAQNELEAALSELQATQTELAKLDGDLSQAKGVLDPFNPAAYSQDAYRQNEATKKAQETQAQIDVTKKKLATIEERIAQLRKRVQLEAMGATPPPGSTPPPGGDQ